MKNRLFSQKQVFLVSFILYQKFAVAVASSLALLSVHCLGKKFLKKKLQRHFCIVEQFSWFDNMESFSLHCICLLEKKCFLKTLSITFQLHFQPANSKYFVHFCMHYFHKPFFTQSFKLVKLQCVAV